jgi:hypothetical protein
VLIYEMSAGFVPFYSDDPVSSRSRTLSHAGPPCCPLLRPPLH